MSTILSGWQKLNMLKKLVAGAALLLASQSSLAISSSGAYIGFLLGTSDMNYTSGNQDLGGASKDEKNRTWYLFTGYQFNRNFAIHTGYMQFGDAEFEGIGGNSAAKSEYSQKALELTGKVIYPLSSVATVYAKGGMAFVNLDRSPNSVASVLSIPKGDKTKIKPMYGLGFTYEFYPNVAGEMAWMQISGGDDIETSTIIGFGLSIGVG